MTVILTGDVHQHGLRDGDQDYSDKAEATHALRYAEIARDHGVSVTLFFTGRAAIAHPRELQALLELGNVEIGGHGWDAFRRRHWHNGLARLTGSPHGTLRLQTHSVRRTCAAIESRSRTAVLSWRDHAYLHDAATPHALAAAGVRVWSDTVDPDLPGPVPGPAGVVVLPINTLPDHEHLFHGPRTRDNVTNDSYEAAEWCDIVCTQVRLIESAGGVATILAHPLCMRIADGWKSFERLCEFLSDYPTAWARDSAGLATAGRAAAVGTIDGSSIVNQTVSSIGGDASTGPK